MNLLIKKAKIVDAESQYNGKVVDLLIENGKIVQIAKDIQAKSTQRVEYPNLHLSKGWIDLHANLQDPGNEYKEDLESGAKAAAAGGFTRLCISPLSDPVRDSKAQIEYITKQNKKGPVEILPYGSVSKQAKGEELAELYDMKSAGAYAFFDGKHSIENPNLLLRALYYCQSFNGLVMNFPHAAEIASEGVMNEGEMSTSLGLKGIPELAEELMISRDLYLCEYSGGRLHFATVSSERGIALIAQAKKRKLNVSCDVSAAHLLLDDSLLQDFDSRLKTLPPLRSKSSIKALIKAIKSDTVDAICSDHWPEDIESKKREFDHAAFGIINLQTAFAAANTALKKDISLEKLIELFTGGPERILELEKIPIEVGAEANFTLFDPEQDFVFEKKDVLSKSKNSPFFGRKLKGVVYGVVNNNKSYLG